MFELIQRAAADAPDQLAVVTEARQLAYGELLDRVLRAAHGLRDRGIERFGFVGEDALDALVLLGASSLLGVEACTYPPVQAGDEVRTLAERFDHDVLVSAREDIEATGATVVSVDDLTDAAPYGGEPASADDPRPLLVFTTGTTGHPRAVRQDWSRVLRPFRDLAPTPDQRWLFAYGLQQFGGLQVLVHVMAIGATLVAPLPRTPREGLLAMRAHGVTHASATPTYWRFLLAELRSDGGPTPGLSQITMGGEAVQSRMFEELQKQFPDARVSQIYGANESGNLRAVRDGRQGLPVSALTEDPEADFALKIVDGELWVRSRIGMLGYYGEDPIDPDAWRPTGDLVEIVGDRVLFRGRQSEVINVGGVKVHPLPIEERISALPGVSIVRVFGRPNNLTGAIVAVEVVPEPGTDEDALDAAIREACADLPAASRPRSIRFVESMKTTGGKLLRGSAGS